MTSVPPLNSSGELPFKPALSSSMSESILSEESVVNFVKCCQAMLPPDSVKASCSESLSMATSIIDNIVLTEAENERKC